MRNMDVNSGILVRGWKAATEAENIFCGLAKQIDDLRVSEEYQVLCREMKRRLRDRVITNYLAKMEVPPHTVQ